MSVVSSRVTRVKGQGARVKSQRSAVALRRESGPRPSTLVPRPFSRLGISLTEVLIAMGILTLGLLGVAALFPVGGYYMQKAEISDRGSAIAQSVMSDIVARGMLNPRSWFAMIPNTATNTKGVWNTRFAADGKYCPTPTAPKSRTFTRPLAESLAQALSYTNQPQVATDPTLTGKQFGYAYVLDPMGVAASATPDTTSAYNRVALPVPSCALPVLLANYALASYSSAWAPFQPSANPDIWPVRRLTLQQPTTGWQMDANMAEHFFRGDDDLAVDFPERDDHPAMQQWKTYNFSGNQVPLKRNWQGDYSWMVSIVPKTTAARVGLATSPESFDYDVSVIVFHKRVLPDGPSDDVTGIASRERMVKASVLSKGPSGGELLLAQYVNTGGSPLDGISESPFDQLKAGQWLMICGPHPNSTPIDPRFVLHWYQVVSIEGKGERLNSSGQTSPVPPTSDPERCIVALRGPEWPWEPGADLSNNLCVGIFPGAVAVHSKSLRLEGWRGSAWGAGPLSGVGTGGAPINPPDFVLH